MKMFAYSAAVTGCVLVLAGCGPDRPPEAPRAKVSGTVTVGKQPVKSGKITFDPGNGQPPADLDILDGKFEGNAPVGKNKVMINAFEKMSMKEKLRKEGKPVTDGPGYDGMTEVNLLPERYNTKSEIQREVEAGKTNEFKFELETK